MRHETDFQIDAEALIRTPAPIRDGFTLTRYRVSNFRSVPVGLAVAGPGRAPTRAAVL